MTHGTASDPQALEERVDGELVRLVFGVWIQCLDLDSICAADRGADVGRVPEAAQRAIAMVGPVGCRGSHLVCRCLCNVAPIPA